MTSTQKVLGRSFLSGGTQSNRCSEKSLNANRGEQPRLVRRSRLRADRQLPMGRLQAPRIRGSGRSCFDCRAGLADVPRVGAKVPPARITLPNGTMVNSEAARRQPHILKSTQACGENCPLLPDVQMAIAEEYWPDMEGLDHRDTTTDFGLPEGTFFDCAFVHLLTTATLDQLRLLYPQGRFEVRRFSPKLRRRDGARREGFRRECLDRASASDRRFCSPKRHRPMRSPA